MEFDVQALMRAVESVSAFFLIGLLGYWLTKLGWFTADTSFTLSRFVTIIVIPVTLFYTINTSTSKDSFLPLLHLMFIPALAILVTMALGWLVSRAVGMARSHRNIFITSSACSNTINIGLPINLALFGTESLPAILIYYMGNTIVFWTVGNSLLASDAENAVKTPILSWETPKRVLSPAIVAFLAGLTLLVLDVKLPAILSIAAGQVAAMTTPLAIICIGISIWLTGLANLKFSRDVCLIALGRFVVSPLVMLAILYFLPVSPLMRNVFLVQCSLPPMSNIALLAIRYKSDSGFAAVAISLCTLCALVTVPLIMVLLQLL